jgi:hypothetical protein
MSTASFNLASLTGSCNWPRLTRSVHWNAPRIGRRFTAADVAIFTPFPAMVGAPPFLVIEIGFKDDRYVEISTNCANTAPGVRHVWP